MTADQLEKGENLKQRISNLKNEIARIQRILGMSKRQDNSLINFLDKRREGAMYTVEFYSDTSTQRIELSESEIKNGLTIILMAREKSVSDLEAEFAAL